MNTGTDTFLQKRAPTLCKLIWMKQPQKESSSPRKMIRYVLFVVRLNRVFTTALVRSVRLLDVLRSSENVVAVVVLLLLWH